MTNAELVTEIRKLRAAYDKPDFLRDRAAAELWRETFRGIPAYLVTKAVDAHIRESEYPPRISSIYQRAKAIYKAERKQIIEDRNLEELEAWREERGFHE